MTAEIETLVARANATLEGVTSGWHDPRDENDCVFNSDGLPVAFYVAPPERAFIVSARDLVPQMAAALTALQADLAALTAELAEARAEIELWKQTKEAVERDVDREWKRANKGEAERDALIGAAYEAAAGECSRIIKNYDVMKPDGVTYEPMRVQRAAKGMVSLARQDIRALTPADATAALATVRAEARKSGMMEAAELCEAAAINAAISEVMQ